MYFAARSSCCQSLNEIIIEVSSVTSCIGRWRKIFNTWPNQCTMWAGFEIVRHVCHWLKFTDQITFLAFQFWICCFCSSHLVGSIRDQKKNKSIIKGKKEPIKKISFIQEEKSRAVLGNSIQYVPYAKRTQLLWIVLLDFF